MLHNHMLWWQQGVIYQVYPRSFKDNNGDGIGDLRGIISQLEYLTWLGINAIWISPIYPSPMADFGYDIANFIDVDPIFGDLTMFDELVKECHKHDIKVIIDFVLNHTSDEHPWFLNSRSSRDNSKRDWYVWADAKPDGSPPNNWLSIFGGSAWEWDAATVQYYLHSFLKKQPDLNWRNEAVKAAMFDVVRFWLERGVDGLRVDVANFIMKDPQLRDNPVNPSQKWTYHKSLGTYDSQIHLYDKGHPDIHTIYRELRRLLDSYSTESPRMAIGEIHVFDWKEWASYYGANLDELHMPFNFGLLGAAWKAQAIHQIVDAVEASLLPGAWPSYVLSNHDDPRIASRVGQVQARAAMMLLLTLRGTPTIYYGDEIGMHNVKIPSWRVQDPWEKSMPGLGLGRDPQRTPMQWDSSPNTGFCPPTTTPWLPLADDYKQINVAVEREDPHSMLSLTRALIQLRRATPALSIGSFHSIVSVSDNCYAYLRQYDQQRYLISLNFSDDEQIVKVPELGSGHVAISTHLDREETIDLTSFCLRGLEGCVIELNE
jgi:alpha-glucosidase